MALGLCACAVAPPAPPSAPTLAIPAAWSTSVPSGTASLARGGCASTTRCSAASSARRCRPTPASGRAQAALRRRGRCAMSAAAALWPTLGASASAQRGRSAGNSQRATPSRPAWMPAGSSTSSAPTAVRWTPARPTPRASAASLGDVQVSIAAEVALDLHHAARRAGAAGDRQRQPGQPARDAADHAVARAGRPGHLARSRAGARRGRADARPVAGAADQPSSRPAMRSRC